MPPKADAMKRRGPRARAAGDGSAATAHRLKPAAMPDRSEQDALVSTLLPDGEPPRVHDNAYMDIDSSDYYFNSYAHFGIHEEMLRDETRTKSYMSAIMDNPQSFQDKVVLDVGCGTGVLSIFAARAGARRVYAVDSSKIVLQAREIVRQNGLAEVVTVIESKVEDLDLSEQVDVIISEWMGYFLFYEAMLDSVIFARDNFMRPGGAMFPDRTALYICGIEDGEYMSYKYDFWDDVYGIDMSHIKNIAFTEPLLDTVNSEQIITDPLAIFDVDLNVVRRDELSFAVPFRLRAWRDDTLHALVCFFDVKFNAGAHHVFFTTSPYSKVTHWKQTVFYLDRPIYMKTGEEVTGTLACRPTAENPRNLDIAIRYNFQVPTVSMSNVLRYRLA